jgi:hypothetical protein
VSTSQRARIVACTAEFRLAIIIAFRQSVFLPTKTPTAHPNLRERGDDWMEYGLRHFAADCDGPMRTVELLA